MRTGPGGYVDHVLAADLAPGWHVPTMASADGEVAGGRVRVLGLTKTEQIRRHATPTARPGEGAGDRPARPDIPVLRAGDGHALARAAEGLNPRP